MTAGLSSKFERDGYVVITGAVEWEMLSSIKNELSKFEQEINAFGIRCLMSKSATVKTLAHSESMLKLVHCILGSNAKPIRSIFFDKTPTANWNVAWHQDTSVALKDKFEVPGFNNWSVKQGVFYAEPPEELLKNIVTLRLHLDHITPGSGGLRVVPGTHSSGRVSSSNLLSIVERSDIVECCAKSGDILLMSPLLFHSSHKADLPCHRRIIHIEYSNQQLPRPLSWYE